MTGPWQWGGLLLTQVAAHGSRPWECFICPLFHVASALITPGSSSASIIFHNHTEVDIADYFFHWCLSLGCHNRYHELSGLNNRYLLSYFWRLGSPRLRSSNVSFWGGPFLAYRWPPSNYVLPWWGWGWHSETGEGEGDRENEGGGIERRKEWVRWREGEERKRLEKGKEKEREGQRGRKIERARALFSHSSCKYTYPTIAGQPSWPHLNPVTSHRPPPPNTITLDVGV